MISHIRKRIDSLRCKKNIYLMNIICTNITNTYFNKINN